MTRILTRLGLTVMAVLVGLMLLAPILVIVPMSFSDSAYLAFPVEDWSTRWYQNFFEDPSWRESTFASLRVAVLVTLCAVVLGTAAALGLVRGHVRWKNLIAGLVVAPLIVPYVIVGLAVYAVALEVGLTESTLGFVMVHTALAVPYVVVNVAAALATYDQSLEHASMSLGANPVTTFRLVTLPIIAPSVGAGALFAFITSWDEVVVSLFLSGPSMTTLPVQMWSGVRVQIDPTVAAVSSLLLLVTIATFILVGLARLINSRRLKRLARAQGSNA
ncbi:ABC transporter permease [Nocardioides sp. SYSU DS0663]|uniref:ABC transporter permease n=1 Tax=Nocardioides sp. SYSU DS0663 TaxID=3416445 RepID=UPI003F4B6DB5